MKNSLYVVYGGYWDKDNNCFTQPNNIAITTFKNREKAENCVDRLLEGYMRLKSYSMNYKIEETYTDYRPLKTSITDITDKHGDIVYSVEVVEIDLRKTIM